MLLQTSLKANTAGPRTEGWTYQEVVHGCPPKLSLETRFVFGFSVDNLHNRISCGFAILWHLQLASVLGGYHLRSAPLAIPVSFDPSHLASIMPPNQLTFVPMKLLNHYPFKPSDFCRSPSSENINRAVSQCAPRSWPCCNPEHVHFLMESSAANVKMWVVTLR